MYPLGKHPSTVNLIPSASVETSFVHGFPDWCLFHHDRGSRPPPLWCHQELLPQMPGVLVDDNGASLTLLISLGSNLKHWVLNECFAFLPCTPLFCKGEGEAAPWEVGYQDAAMQLVVC